MFGRPAWEACGAFFAEAVEPYEKMKLRLLNGTQTMIAHLGIMHDREFVREVMAVPCFVSKVKRNMQVEVKTPDPVPGIDLPTYMDELIERSPTPQLRIAIRRWPWASARNCPSAFWRLLRKRLRLERTQRNSPMLLRFGRPRSISEET